MRKNSEKLAGKGTVLRLMVTETNINIDVTISDFECTDYGGYGNKKYSLEFVQYRSLKVYTTDELKIVKFVKKTVTRPAAAAPKNKGSYTVKSGDNLWSIARKFYGAPDPLGQKYIVRTSQR